MTDRLDYWMIEVLEEAMKVWWKSRERVMYTDKKALENRFLDIGKFELIKKRLNEIQVGYDSDIIKGLSIDTMIIDEISPPETKGYACHKCGTVLEPTEHNPNYLMCYKCIEGYSIEELGLISFAKKFFDIDLSWYQREHLLKEIMKIDENK